MHSLQISVTISKEISRATSVFITLFVRQLIGCFLGHVLSIFMTGDGHTLDYQTLEIICLSFTIVNICALWEWGWGECGEGYLALAVLLRFRYKKMT